MACDRKAPWFKFYGADWRADLGLRECSYAARGLWMDMLTIMHEAEPYGHLLIAGKPATAKRLAVLLGGTEREVSGLLGQLEEAGVFSRDDAGTIYSRRMVRDARRDAEKRDVGERFGHLGGNPNIRRGTAPKEDRVRRFRPSDNPAKADRIFDKDGGCCHWCRTPLQRERPGPDFFHCAHVVAVRDGGTNDDENLVAACADCNRERPRQDAPDPKAQNGSDPNPPSRSDPNRDRKSDPNAQRLEARSQYQNSNPAAFPRNSRARVTPPPMPTLSDPPVAWVHLADRLPDGTAKTERDDGGVVRPVCAGSYLDVCAEAVADAAKMDGSRRPLDWQTLCVWLRDGFEMQDHILPVIRRIADRPGYEPPQVLRYFDGAVRAKRSAA